MVPKTAPEAAEPKTKVTAPTAMTKENTLYLPIKQIYFDQIIAGTKKIEYREIKETTAKRYLKTDNSGSLITNPDCTKPGNEYYIDDYNNGKFPFLPKDIKYLNLAVGYDAVRDTAVVEVTNITFLPQNIQDRLYAFWFAEFHLGKVISLKRK